MLQAYPNLIGNDLHSSSLGALERHGSHAIKELPAPARCVAAGGSSRCSKPDSHTGQDISQSNTGLPASLPRARELASITNAQVSLRTAASLVSMVVRACQKHPDIYSSYYSHPANDTITTIITTNTNNIGTTAPPTRPRPSRTARQIPTDLAGRPEPPMPDSAIAATYRGHVASTQDALIVIEACLRGVLYHTCRRPRSSEESSLAKSGNIFVYERGSSGIRSWEDGITWSTPQRVGNFEVCRQLSSSSSRSRSNGTSCPLTPSEIPLPWHFTQSMC